MLLTMTIIIHISWIVIQTTNPERYMMMILCFLLVVALVCDYSATFTSNSYIYAKAEKCEELEEHMALNEQAIASDRKLRGLGSYFYNTIQHVFSAAGKHDILHI
jgi:hypothetical protein